MRTPSGTVYSSDDLNLLKMMAEVGFVRYSDKPFKLKSGIMSNVYVFGREDLTDNPKLEWLIGTKIARVVYSNSVDDRQPCLIGLPTAGTALAQAAAMASAANGWIYPRDPIAHRIMREQLKSHSAHQGWVNGRPDHSRQRYWIVDNVATDGATKIEAATKLMADEYPAYQMPVLIYVDRQQGALQRLKNEGFEDVRVVFNLLDLTFAFGELELWPKSAIARVEEEIRAHQFVV